MILLTYCKDTSISKHQYHCNGFAPFAFQSILVLDIASLCLDNCFNPSRHALYKLQTLLNWYPLSINLNSLLQFMNPLRRGVMICQSPFEVALEVLNGVEVRRLCKPYHSMKILLLKPILHLLASMFGVIILLEDDVRRIKTIKLQRIE